MNKYATLNVSPKHKTKIKQYAASRETTVKAVVEKLIDSITCSELARSNANDSQV